MRTIKKSLDDAKYSCTFTDQFIRYTHVVGIKSKGDAADAFEEYKKCAEAQKYFENGVQHFHTYKSLNMSPFEKLTGKRPNIRHIRQFGCAAFVYKANSESKLHQKSEKEILLACYDHGVYGIELLSNEKVINSAHVKFDEGNLPSRNSTYRVSKINGNTLLPSHVVLKIKRDENGNPQ